jgi:hypothetical protein
MNDHTVAEKKLKTEIHYKNTLRRDLVYSVRQLHDWQEKLASIGNVRKDRKLRGTMERYQSFISDLRSFLVPLLNELEEAIQAEMSFSEKEIAQFRAEVSEEMKIAAEAREAFQKARTGMEAADRVRMTPEELAVLKQSYSKAWRAFRLEKHKLDHSAGELASEQTDRKIFEIELKRIQVERHFIEEL